MLLEVGWLTAALTLQLYVPDAKGFWIVCSMLGGYILYFNERLSRTPRLVLWLSLGLSLGAIGGLATGAMRDFYQPLHLALTALAVAGLFVSEYNRLEDARFLAVALMVLLPVASWRSVARNNLLEQWAEGSRAGVNLQALFGMIAASYTLLLRGPWKLLALPFYCGLFLLGSRTGFFTALAFPVVYFSVSKEVRRELFRHAGLLGMVVLLIAGGGVYQRIQRNAETADLPVDTSRHSGEALREGIMLRLDLGLYWTDFLWRQPTLFGNGYDTYGSRSDASFSPDNGFLHLFNGLGVVCGVIYLSVCFTVLQRLWRVRATLPPHIAWAGAFFASLLLRHVGESQFIVLSVHIAGFAVTYGTGLAIWGADRFKPSLRNPIRSRPKA
jgi:hypothetical protein